MVSGRGTEQKTDPHFPSTTVRGICVPQDQLHQNVLGALGQVLLQPPVDKSLILQKAAAAAGEQEIYRTQSRQMGNF